MCIRDSFRPIRTLPGMAERTITLNSFSKNFLMTGWRVGVIIAEPVFLVAVMDHQTVFCTVAPDTDRLVIRI